MITPIVVVVVVVVDDDVVCTRTVPGCCIVAEEESPLGRVVVTVAAVDASGRNRATRRRWQPNMGTPESKRQQ
jgi:hypothetical protein